MDRSKSSLDPKSFTIQNRPTETDISRLMKNPDNCRRCYGNGQIANDDEQSPWLVWLALPPGSDLAVQLGLVKPEPCPKCGGTGRKDGKTL